MLMNSAEIKVKLVTDYKAKKWISYGDSITASNGWQPAVAAKLGLIHTKRGIGGTTIAEIRFNSLGRCRGELYSQTPCNSTCRNHRNFI